MSAALASSVILGVLAAAMTLIAFVSASRANRSQANAAVVAVDAEAYTRAREIYEGAMGTLRVEVESMRGEIGRLRESNMDLQGQVKELTTEIDRLRSVRLMIHGPGDIYRSGSAPASRTCIPGPQSPA